MTNHMATNELDTVRNASGEIVGTVAEVNNDGYLVYQPTCVCGHYGGAFTTLREARNWLQIDEQNYHARTSKQDHQS